MIPNREDLPYPVFTEGGKLLAAIGEDLRSLASLKGKINDQFAKRMLVRVSFSLIEAFLNVLRGRILDSLKYEKYDFSKNDIRILLEGDYAASEDGKIIFSMRYPSVEKALPKIINMLAATRRYPPIIKDGADIPDYFCKAKDVRDRLTHPKKHEDLTISNEEAQCAAKTLQWFMQLHSWTADAEKHYLHESSKKMHASIGTQMEQLKNLEGKKQPV